MARLIYLLLFWHICLLFLLNMDPKRISVALNFLKAKQRLQETLSQVVETEAFSTFWLRASAIFVTLIVNDHHNQHPQAKAIADCLIQNLTKIILFSTSILFCNHLNEYDKAVISLHLFGCDFSQRFRQFAGQIICFNLVNRLRSLTPTSESSSRLNNSCILQPVF
jgi:hypothetical protein